MIELNGAMEFASDYSGTEDVFTAVTRELARVAAGKRAAGPGVRVARSG